MSDANERSSDHESDAEVPSTGANSGYYFFKSTPKDVASQFAPQRVEVSQNQQDVASDGRPSVWNKANTWEERDLSSWATETIKELLTSVKIPCQGEDSIAMSSVETTRCHATIVFVRGKKRHGYEIGVSCKWSGTIAGKKVDGKLEFPEVEDDCDDQFPANVTASGNDKEHECARMAVRKALPEFQKKLKDFDKLFRQK